ncbi:hypothetical protein KOW79_013869, partial [Hemibagrus wyckioides]
SPDCELPTISTGPARLDRPSAGFNRKIKKLQKKQLKPVQSGAPKTHSAGIRSNPTTNPV